MAMVRLAAAKMAAKVIIVSFLWLVCSVVHTTYSLAPGNYPVFEK
jgi:hypothetical protein